MKRGSWRCETGYGNKTVTNAKKGVTITMCMKYFIYVRRSCEREDRQTLSIDAQLRTLNELAKREELEIVDTIVESQSAYKPGRPEFNKVLERIELGQAQGLLVYQPSRLARNAVDGGRLIYMMDEKKLLEIRSPGTRYTNSGNDKFFLQMEFGMAKKSSDDTSEYMKRDARSKLLKGEWTGMAVIGYLNIDSNGKIAGNFYDHEKQTLLMDVGRPLRRIEIDPIVGTLIRRFFDWYLAENHTLAESVKFINDMGIRSPRFKGKFSKSMVERILRNPFYTGQMRYEGELFPGNHDAMLSVQEFEEIQRRLSLKKHQKLVKQEFVYRGLVKCAECGCSIVGIRKIKPTGKLYEYYTCSKRRGSCSQAPLKPESIDWQVEERLQSVSIDERVWKLCKELLKLHYGQQIEGQVHLREKWEKDMQSIDRRLGKLLDGYVDETIDKESYSAKKNELLRDKRSLEEKLQDGSESTKHWLLDAEEFFDKAHYAYERFADPSSPLEVRQGVLKSIGWNLRLSNGNLEWDYKKPFDILAQRQTVPVAVGTRQFRQDKKKNASAYAEATFWRAGRDSNPRSSP